MNTDVLPVSGMIPLALYPYDDMEPLFSSPTLSEGNPALIGQKGQQCGTLRFSLVLVRANCLIAGDLRHHVTSLQWKLLDTKIFGCKCHGHGIVVKWVECSVFNRFRIFMKSLLRANERVLYSGILTFKAGMFLYTFRELALPVYLHDKRETREQIWLYVAEYILHMSEPSVAFCIP